LDSSQELDTSHLLLVKVVKLLSETPNLNGTLVDGSFHATARPTEVEVSVLGTDDDILKLSPASVSKKAVDLATEITHLHHASRASGGRRLSVFQSLAVALRRLIALLLPEVQLPLLVSQSTSPYGAALIIPCTEEGIDHSLYLFENAHSPTASLFLPPMTLCLPKIALKRQHLSKSLSVSVLIEKNVGTLRQGTHFFHQLKRSLQRSATTSSQLRR
jgi:hypothetical protein